MRREVWLLILAAVVLLYLPHLQGAGWVYEDATWQHGGMRVVGEPGWWTTQMPTGREMLEVPSRHLTMWTFYLEPDGPRAAHVVNLALHLLNALLIIGLCTTWGFASPWVAGALWAVLPLTTEAVAYAAGRPELLCATWLLIALWALTSDREARIVRWGVLLLVLGLGLITKPTFIVAGPLLAWVGWWRWPSRRVLPGFPLALLAGAAIAAWLSLRVLFRPSMAGVALVPFWHWFAAQSAGVWTLLVLALIPAHLSIDHAWWAYGDQVQILSALVVVAVTMSLLAAVRLGRRRWLIFALGWWLLAWAPRLVVRDPLGWLHEHHAYVPLLGLVIALSAGLTQETPHDRH